MVSKEDIFLRHFVSIRRNIGVAKARMISDVASYVNVNTREHLRRIRVGIGLEHRQAKLGINLHAIKWLIYRWRWIGRKRRKLRQGIFFA